MHLVRYLLRLFELDGDQLNRLRCDFVWHNIASDQYECQQMSSQPNELRQIFHVKDPHSPHFLTRKPNIVFHDTDWEYNEHKNSWIENTVDKSWSSGFHGEMETIYCVTHA